MLFGKVFAVNGGNKYQQRSVYFLFHLHEHKIQKFNITTFVYPTYSHVLRQRLWFLYIFCFPSSFFVWVYLQQWDLIHCNYLFPRKLIWYENIGNLYFWNDTFNKNQNIRLAAIHWIVYQFDQSSLIIKWTTSPLKMTVFIIPLV